ncbi:MAG TPA: NUDIX domain-containing protein [Nocardioides sp.]
MRDARHYASVALVDSNGWILLQERDEHPVVDPERWGFPGGGIEPGEGAEEAAYRELAEETGVRLDGGLKLFGEFAIHEGERDRCTLYAAGTDLTDDDVECHEGRQMVFVEPERARTLDLTRGAALILPTFLDSDTYARLAR